MIDNDYKFDMHTAERIFLQRDVARAAGVCFFLGGIMEVAAQMQWKLLKYMGLLIGIMDNKLETTIVHWGNIGIMENRMETT